MAEFKRISFIILMLTIAFCSAVPSRNRQLTTTKKIQHLKQRPAVLHRRVLARQEAVTPYPSADELKPETPFQEGNIPDEVYGPPDETYGPPEIDQTPANQLPSEEAPEEFAPSIDAEEFQGPEEKIVAPLKAHISRIIKGKKSSKKNLSSRLLVKKRQRLIVSPVSSYKKHLLSSQTFAHNTHYHSW